MALKWIIVVFMISKSLASALKIYDIKIISDLSIYDVKIYGPKIYDLKISDLRIYDLWPLCSMSLRSIIKYYNTVKQA